MASLNTDHTTWDLSLITTAEVDQKFIEAEQKRVSEATRAFVAKWQSREDHLQDPAVLAEALTEYEHWAATCGTDGVLGYYLWLQTELDQLDKELKAQFNKIEEFSRKIVNEIEFFELRIAKIPSQVQPKFLAHPDLQPYKHFLEKLFAEAAHHLSESEEKIMNLKSQPAAANWIRMVSAFMSKQEAEVLTEAGKPETKTFEEILTLGASKQKPVRDSAGAAAHKILAAHAEIAEHELNSILLNKKIDDELRGFARPDSARHLSDDVPTPVVDTVVAAVAASFPTAQKFYALKAKLINQLQLAYYERNVEVGELKGEYSYAEAAQLVYDTLNELDPEFGRIVQMFIEQGHVDVFPKKGKAGGAFCAYNSIQQPVYVLLNFTNKLRDILTIAHEFGHGINDELMRTKQNALNFGTPMSTAEVASTFMEDYVLQKLLANVSDEDRLALYMYKLNDEISTIHRQIAAYKFEQDLHHNFRDTGYLSHEAIGGLFEQHMTAYLGDAVNFEPEARNWWIHWSHFRRSFYVYSYASGLLISKALQAKAKADPKFITKVKEFLAAGSSAAPAEIFKNLGVDIEDAKFWEAGLAEVDALVEEATALAQKLKKV